MDKDNAVATNDTMACGIATACGGNILSRATPYGVRRIHGVHGRFLFPKACGEPMASGDTQNAT